MKSKLFDLDEITFEVAIETIGRLIAVESGIIHTELAKSRQPDKRRLRRYSRRRSELQTEIEKLYAGDELVLRKAVSVYAKRVTDLGARH